MTPAGLAHLGRAGKQTLACAVAAELSADRITATSVPRVAPWQPGCS